MTNLNQKMQRAITASGGTLNGMLTVLNAVNGSVSFQNITDRLRPAQNEWSGLFDAIRQLGHYGFVTIEKDVNGDKIIAVNLTADGQEWLHGTDEIAAGRCVKQAAQVAGGTR